MSAAQARAVKPFVCSAGIGDHLDAGAVDLGQGLIFLLIGAARYRRLAVAHVGRREEADLLPVEGHRDAAHGDVEVAVGEPFGQAAPGRGRERDRNAERLGERPGHVDVEAGIFARFPVERGERPIVAARADPQHMALENGLEARAAGAGWSRNRRQKRCDEKR